jgi:hypothetical protein
MTISLCECFIVPSESSLRLISRLLYDEMIYRLFGLGGDTGTEGPEMMLSGAARLMETTDEESEADRWEWR